jgi:hypothetical protein
VHQFTSYFRGNALTFMIRHYVARTASVMVGVRSSAR